MPTIRIFSLQPDYYRFQGARKDFAELLQSIVSNVLGEKLEDVEAFWLPPIDFEDAVNVLPYSVDIEFSLRVGETAIEKLAAALLRAFAISPRLLTGTRFGVWIKTPEGFFWREATKP